MKLLADGLYVLRGLPPSAINVYLAEDAWPAAPGGARPALEVPGHSRGHVAYWRERDRVLILGDVLNGMNVRTGRRELHEPPDIFTPDPPRNRESARRLAALEPELVCFGARCATRARLASSSRACPADAEP